MPRKYPRPERQFFESKQDFYQRYFDWNNSYECQRCQHRFHIYFGGMPIGSPEPPAQPKPSLISRLLAWGIAIFIIYLMFSWVNNQHPDKEASPEKPDAIAEIIKEKEAQTPAQQEVNIPTVEELNEVFPLEAEQAAHGKYPNDPTKTN